MVGGMLHGAFDFQTHLLPILMMAALVIGLIMPAGSPTRSLFARGGYAALVITLVVLSVIAVGKESLHMTKWLNWEKSRQTSYEVGSGELPLRLNGCYSPFSFRGFSVRGGRGRPSAGQLPRAGDPP